MSRRGGRGHARAVFPSPPAHLKSIGDRLRWLLDVTGMPQRELARQAGLAETQINVILKRLRTRPHAIEVETVYKIAHGAGVRGEWLLTGAGAPDASEVADLPRLHDLHGWAHLLRQAQQYDPPLPLWCWKWAGTVHLPQVTAWHLSPADLYRIASLGYSLFVQDVSPPQLLPPAAPPPRTGRRRT